MKPKTLLLVLLTILLSFSCSNNEAYLDEQTPSEINLKKSLDDNSSDVTSRRPGDSYYHRKLIELHADYQQCIGNPAYSGNLNIPAEVEINSQVSWQDKVDEMFEVIPYEGDFDHAWGFYINQAYFHVPIFSEYSALPSSNELYYMINADYNNLPCYVNYLIGIKALKSENMIEDLP